MTKKEATEKIINLFNEKVNGIISITVSAVTYTFVDGYTTLTMLKNLKESANTKSITSIIFRDSTKKHTTTLEVLGDIIAQYSATIDTINSDKEDKINRISLTSTDVENDVIVNESWNTTYNGSITKKSVDIDIGAPLAPLKTYTIGTNSPVLNTDTLCSSIGKLQAQLNSKQNELLSGTNIKTINGNSIIGGGDISIAGGGSSTNPFSGYWFIDDFFDYLVTTRGFYGGVFSTGTMAFATTILNDGNHPGIVRMTSSTTVNSGAYLRTNATSILLKNGYRFRSCVRFPSITTTTVRMGFIDTGTSADCVDGVYFEILNGVVTFKTSNNSTRTIGTGSYTCSINTWYEFRVDVKSTTSVIGYVYDESGSLLWTSQTVTTNIPSTTSRQTGCGIVYSNSGTVAVEGVQVDYLALYIPQMTTGSRTNWI